MKIIKVVYNNSTDFIVEIVNCFKKFGIIEFYNMDHFKDRKKGSPIQGRFGTKNLPLIVFADENLEEVDAIWPENSPDWKKEIINKLKHLNNI